MQPKRIHILHVAYHLIKGGIETWLLNVLRFLPADQFQMDFLVHGDIDPEHEAELRKHGSRCFSIIRPTRFFAYRRAFHAFLAENGPYDIVHSHVEFAGLVLRLARNAGIAIRIAHIHVDFRPENSGGWLRRFIVNWTNGWLRQDMTAGLACSRVAGDSLYWPGWENDPRCRVLYYGVDFRQYQSTVDVDAIRQEFGFTKDTLVVGHVGRFDLQKNHDFLVQVAAEVCKIDAGCKFLLIGDGPLRKAIEEKVRFLNLENAIVFAGRRSDVPRLMQGAMDVMILPSLFEGLPLVGLEAQGAGLPIVMSNVISDETDWIPELISRVSLDETPAVWAQAIMKQKAMFSNIDKPSCNARMMASPFFIVSNIAKLAELYHSLLAKHSLSK